MVFRKRTSSQQSAPRSEDLHLGGVQVEAGALLLHLGRLCSVQKHTEMTTEIPAVKQTRTNLQRVIRLRTNTTMQQSAISSTGVRHRLRILPRPVRGEVPMAATPKQTDNPLGQQWPAFPESHTLTHNYAALPCNRSGRDFPRASEDPLVWTRLSDGPRLCLVVGGAPHPSPLVCGAA